MTLRGTILTLWLILVDECLCQGGSQEPKDSQEQEPQSQNLRERAAKARDVIARVVRSRVTKAVRRLVSRILVKRGG
jgi:hypothetical protein